MNVCYLRPSELDDMSSVKHFPVESGSTRKRTWKLTSVCKKKNDKLNDVAAAVHKNIDAQMSLITPTWFTAKLRYDLLSYEVNWLLKCGAQTSSAALALAKPRAQWALAQGWLRQNKATWHWVPVAALMVLAIIILTLTQSFVLFFTSTVLEMFAFFHEIST